MLELFYYIYFMNIEEIYACFLQSSGITTDTRKITKDSMFFALKGDNFNGNTFAEKAIKNGARFAIVDEKEFATTPNIILVNNVLRTLQQLATYHRVKLNIPVIALTGSNGKTTTKELINAILSKKYKTSATAGNFNNHIGVPLTLLKFTKDTQIGIIEMGANHPKEIELLSNIALPDFGLITNFGKAHLEGFGSIEGVIKAKSELLEHLKQHHKTIFVNLNDEIQVQQVGNYDSTFTFGKGQSNFNDISLNESHPLVSLNYNNNIIKSHLTGSYNYNNLSVAIAIGTYFKVSPSAIKEAIETYIPSNNRSQTIQAKSNTIILDAYNANPTSMIAALDNFITYKAQNKIIFLGDMFELGSTAEMEHQNIINYIETHYKGKAHVVGAHFYKTNINKTNITRHNSFKELKETLTGKNITDSLILIKGSRGMALERILDLL